MYLRRKLYKRGVIYTRHLQLNAVCVGGVKVKWQGISASGPKNCSKPDIDYSAAVRLESRRTTPIDSV
jgi:hypothetical protein